MNETTCGMAICSKLTQMHAHSATLTPTAAHGIKTVRFTVKCRPLVPLALRRREKRTFGPYSTDRLIDLGRRLFMKLHSMNEFSMFKIAISPVKKPVVNAI